jgi:hypothetical protein
MVYQNRLQAMVLKRAKTVNRIPLIPSLGLICTVRHGPLVVGEQSKVIACSVTVVIDSGRLK